MRYQLFIFLSRVTSDSTILNACIYIIQSFYMKAKLINKTIIFFIM